MMVSNVALFCVDGIGKNDPTNSCVHPSFRTARQRVAVIELVSLGGMRLPAADSRCNPQNHCQNSEISHVMADGIESRYTRNGSKERVWCGREDSNLHALRR